MKDVQAQPDYRGVPLLMVGVRDIHLPLCIMTKDGGHQPVSAAAYISADLPEESRGTHMSRFVQNLSLWSGKKISSREIRDMLWDMRISLYARRVEIALVFRYFISKPSPVTSQNAVMDYLCEFRGIQREEDFTFLLGLQVPVNILCPCSKEISEYGAHNQRALIRVRIEYDRDAFIWIEDLVSSLEELGSVPLYPLLKREDEKHVTEQAYRNPRFVEDVVRDAVLLLKGDHRIAWFEVECLSAESLHNHDAFAYHTWCRDESAGRPPCTGGHILFGE